MHLLYLSASLYPENNFWVSDPGSHHTQLKQVSLSRKFAATLNHNMDYTKWYQCKSAAYSQYCILKHYDV